MWHAYYHHNPLKLFYLLMKLAREFFGVNYLTAIGMGYYSASAAVDFSWNKGREKEERIVKRLTKFYKLISDRSLEEFDYRRAAQLELQWWMVDRYPERYPISREEALAKGMASIFNVDHSKLLEYGKFRAEAMVVQDRAELNKEEADWVLVEDLLRSSFRALKHAVN